MKKTPTPAPPPPPAMIAAEQLATLTNLTKRRLYQLSEENKIPPASNGQFPLLTTITQLFAWYQRDGEDLARERLAIARETHRRLKTQNDVRDRKLVEKSEVERQCLDAESFYFEELDRLGRAAPGLAGLSAVDVNHKLTALVNLIRDQSRIKFAEISEPPTPK